jgi:hypothetical protein
VCRQFIELSLHFRNVVTIIAGRELGAEQVVGPMLLDWKRDPVEMAAVLRAPGGMGAFTAHYCFVSVRHDLEPRCLSVTVA